MKNKIILRTCNISRIKLDRQLLFRIVLTPKHEVLIDDDYKIQGRGMYLSKDKEIINIAKKKNIISKTFHQDVDLNIYDELLKKI